MLTSFKNKIGSYLTKNTLDKDVFHIDFPLNGSSTSRKDDKLEVKGWGFVSNSKVKSVHVSLNNVNWIAAEYGLERIDVYDHFGHEIHFKNVGYSAIIDLSNIPNDQTTLFAKLTTVNGKVISATSTFTLRPEAKFNDDPTSTIQLASENPVIAPIEIDRDKWLENYEGVKKEAAECIDIDFYLARNPDVVDEFFGGGLNPIEHYMIHGCKQGRDPHPLFSNLFYRGQFPDLGGLEDPLQHYLTLNVDENPNTSTIFDAQWYKLEYDLDAEEKAFLHYCRNVDKIEVFPNSCKNFYLSQLPEYFDRFSNAITAYPNENLISNLFTSMPNEFVDFEFASNEANIDEKLRDNFFAFPQLRAFNKIESPIVIYTHDTIDDDYIEEYKVTCKKSIDWALSCTNDKVYILTNLIHLKDFAHENEHVSLVYGDSMSKFFKNGINNSDNVCFIRVGISPSLNAWTILERDIKKNKEEDIVGCSLLRTNYRISSSGLLNYQNIAFIGFNQSPLHSEYYWSRKTPIADPRMFIVDSKLLGKSIDFDNDDGVNSKIVDWFNLINRKLNSNYTQGTVFGRDTIEQFDDNKWYERIEVNDKESETNSCDILIVESEWLTPDKDAGSLYTRNLITILQNQGYNVWFHAQAEFNFDLKYTPLLTMDGVKCKYIPFTNSLYDIQFDKDPKIIFLNSFHVANTFYYDIRPKFSESKFVFNTIDLHGWRLEREARLVNNQRDINKAQYIASLELSLITQHDASIVLSLDEYNELDKDYNYANIHLLPIPVEIPAIDLNPSNRKDICFIGGFRHYPNVDAMDYFFETLWPKISEVNKDIKFHIVGSNMPDKFSTYLNDRVVYHGFVEDLETFLSGMKMTIAPLRIGAGIKGKILSSLVNGVPCVTTKIGAEGMGLTHEDNILISDDPKKIAKFISKLNTNDKYWKKIAKNGAEFIQDNFSFEKISSNMEDLISSLNID